MWGVAMTGRLLGCGGVRAAMPRAGPHVQLRLALFTSSLTNTEATMEDIAEPMEEITEAVEEATAATINLATAQARRASSRPLAVLASQARLVAVMACPARVYLSAAMASRMCRCSQGMQ